MPPETVTDVAEARRILDEWLGELRAYGYDRLRAMNSTRVTLFGIQFGGDCSDLREVRAESGRLYQLETDVSWNDRRRKTLRVDVSLLEERSVYRTLSGSFGIAPDGTFLWE